MKMFEKDGKMVKECCKCHEIKETSEYYKKKITFDGFNHRCKSCCQKDDKEKNSTEEQKRKSRLYYKSNKKIINERNNNWRKKTLKNNPNYDKEIHIRRKNSPKAALIKERDRINSIKYRKRNKLKIKERQSSYEKSEHGKKKRRLRENLRYKNDPEWKMKNSLNKRIRKILRARNIEKTIGTIELIGCSALYFKLYIESQFTKNMCWSKMGQKKNDLNLDHIIPCECFDLTQISHQKACFNYKNIRPLWGRENRRKSDKLPNGKRARDLSSDQKKQALIELGFGYLFN